MQESIDELFPDVRDEVRALAGQVRREVLTTLPEATEIFCHGTLGYGPTASGVDRILYIALQNGYVNLGFFHGGQLDDPAHLLEGSGKRMRHIKIKHGQAANSVAVAQLLRQAWSDGIVFAAARHQSARRA